MGPKPTIANYYLVFFYRLLIVLLLFFACRFIFYYYNRSAFTGIGVDQWKELLSGGLRFDLAALFYFNSLFILLSLLPLPFRDTDRYQQVLKYIFLFTNGLAILLNCIDFIYYKFTLRRTNRSVFKEFSNETNLDGLIANFIVDYWHVGLIFVLLVVLMTWLYNRLAVRITRIKKLPYYLVAVAVLLVMIPVAIGGIRGDLRHSTRPITISNAGDYVRRPQEINLVLNTPFVMIRTWRYEELKEVNYYPEDELEKIYSPLHQPDTSQPFQKKNIVIFILESFGREAVGAYNTHLDGGHYKGFTPFLDSLMNHSKVYTNSFANGRKSIDGIPSILASIPNGREPFVLTPYAADSIRSLPMMLREEGYYTSFFHGAPNGSMGFKALSKLLGIEHYYGKDEYGNDADYDGIWGIWDEPFFRFFGNKLSSFRQPFQATMFSASSHHPFKVPEQYKGKFPKGPLPVLECISYTDHALRQFFAHAKDEPWFNNTIFVIAADHATVSYHPNYLNAWGEVAIPIIFYEPANPVFRGTDSNLVVQQIDIMPSLLDKINYPKPYIAFGKNIFDPVALNFSVHFQGGYRWIEDGYLLFTANNKPVSLHNYKADPLFKNNLVNADTIRTNRMQRNLMAFVQQYNNRLIRNNLYVKK